MYEWLQAAPGQAGKGLTFGIGQLLPSLRAGWDKQALCCAVLFLSPWQILPVSSLSLPDGERKWLTSVITCRVNHSHWLWDEGMWPSLCQPWQETQKGCGIPPFSPSSFHLLGQEVGAEKGWSGCIDANSQHAHHIGPGSKADLPCSLGAFPSCLPKQATFPSFNFK